MPHHTPTDTASAVITTVDDVLLAAHPQLFGATSQDRAVALAQALAASPPAALLGGEALLVVRPGASARIGLLGRIAAERQALGLALDWQVRETLQRLRPLGYSEVEAACSALADRLRARFGAEVVSAARIVGIPRGGLVVAGLLAYALGRDGGTSEREPEAPTTTIVVDDCILSGSRVRRWLRDHPGPPVVLAQLASHPDARAAIERDEPAVDACVAALDLVDHAPDRRGADYAAWRQRWAQRAPDDYWTGHPDHVCFPWNEPDQVLWNEPAGRSERGWAVVPPAWCLKNRVRGRVPLQILQASPGPLCPPDDVLWAVHDDGSTLLAAGDTGVVVRLTETAALVWDEIVSAGTAEGAAEELHRRHDVDVRQAQRDVEQLVDTLRGRGLLP